MTFNLPAVFMLHIYLLLLYLVSLHEQDLVLVLLPVFHTLKFEFKDIDFDLLFM